MSEFAEVIEELRAFATRNSMILSPELARAVWLAIPSVRFGGDVFDAELNRQIRLDRLAAEEYAGYHGIKADRVEHEADFIVGLYLMERDAQPA